MPMTVPSILLKKLYIKGSFKNSATGFELSLRNALAPGTLIGIISPQIDGIDIPLENVLITSGDDPPVRASEISVRSPQSFPFNVVVRFQVELHPLAPGLHRITMQIDTKEVGRLKIDTEDSIE